MKKTTILNNDECEVFLFENVFDFSTENFIDLKNSIPWRKDKIRIFGKEIIIPRLQAWFADNKTLSYKYSSIKMTPEPWNSQLLKIKKITEKITGFNFNSALINFYESGKDYAAWHSDNEKELGINPTIASVSFGGVRSFHLRHIKTKDTIKLELPSNSILLMIGKTQSLYKHQLAKTARQVDARINITFRFIKK